MFSAPFALFLSSLLCLRQNHAVLPVICAADDLKSVTVSCLRLSSAGIRCVLLETEPIFFFA